jgi:hypothetical protein
MTKKAAEQAPRKEAMITTIPSSMITRQQGEHVDDGYQGAQHEGDRQEQDHPPQNTEKSNEMHMKQAVSANYTAKKKGPTTIFPKKKVMVKKKKEDKKPNEVTSSDEEFLRATEALEKEVTLSDEEWVEAAITLEQMQLEGQEADGHQGAQHEGVRQVQEHRYPEVCDQEACHSLDLKLSPRMMKNHLEGTQEWKEGNDGQDGPGQGDLQLQGAHHQVREEDGQDGHGPGDL